jgi:hypothetical protein
MKKMEQEIVKAAEVLGLSIEETREKLLEIATQNQLNPDLDTDRPLLKGLFRQWFGQAKKANASPTTTTGNSLVKNGFGIIVGIEDCRDMMEYQRNQIQGEYQRDSDATYRSGKIAKITSTATNMQITQWLNDEEITREKPLDWKPPAAAIQVDNGWIIPVDNRPSFGSGDKNKDYGKPLPLQQWMRRVHFIGEVEGNTIQYWTLSLKHDIAQNFSADCYRLGHIKGIWNTERNQMYGVRNQTAFTYNDVLDPNDDNYRDTSSVNIQDLLADGMKDYISPLTDLEHYHQSTSTLPLSQRMVLTDGIVTNMILRPNSTGNRTIFISDLSAEFDYDSDASSSIACWVPPQVDLDFGIGSNIILMGRTNQREVDGVLTTVSLNTFGIMVTDKRGETPVFDDASEDDSDWF